MIRLTLAMFAFSMGVVCGLACGSEESNAPRRVNTPEPTAMNMEAAPVPPSTMSVRSGPAKVPEEDIVAWRSALAKNSGGGGSGRMMPLTPLNEKFREVDRRSAELTRRISAERAQALVKQMVNTGMSADRDDPCARLMAMYDSVSSELELTPEIREEALRRCQAMPSSHLACLKPESERSPFERRTCRRFLRDTDAPDLFGENGSIMQQLPPGVQAGPQRIEGPVRTEDMAP